MLTNAFFSCTVRIQEERGHVVVSEGPYRYVRHPGYVGFIVSGLVTPIVLDSLWALVPAALAASLLVFRTSLEDSTLRKELSGYDEYAGRVRYRLLPGVW
jgi:protein-S-isoprenylcysteine O-methyltransferase Ste14